MSEKYGFWKMEPHQTVYTQANGIMLDIFKNATMDTRMMKWPGNEYIIGGSTLPHKIEARLPAGEWEVVRYDLRKKEREVIGSGISGRIAFNFDNSPAAMVHFRKL